MWILPEQKKYEPALACIYCGARGCLLTEEHIIPRAIGGRLLFPDASCEGCQKIINEQFEGKVLGFMFKSLRAQLGLKSRKKPIPKTLRVASYKMNEDGNFPQDMTDANFRWEDIDLEKYPAIMVHMGFERPGILIGAQPTNAFILQQLVVIGLGMDGFDVVQRTRELNSLGLSTMEPFSPDLMCRMIAKIAHGAAVANFPASSFKPYLPEIILGKDVNISYLVGGNGKKPRRSDQLHSIKFHSMGRLLIGNVTLFAKYGGPTYEVVVGETSAEISKWSMSEEVIRPRRIEF